MVTRISGGEGAAAIRGLKGLDALDETAAKKTLEQLATQIHGRNGVLKLMHTSKDRDMVFERKGDARFFARRDSKMAATAEALRKIYERAGLAPQARAQLDRYLTAHRNRVGGSEFAALIREHLRPPETSNPSGLSDHVIQRVLPRPAERVGRFMRSEVFGTPAERTALPDATAVAIAILKNKPEFKADYAIGAPDDPDRLQGLTISAQSGQQALNPSRPVVLFLGGSHQRIEPNVEEFADELGPGFEGGVNLLAINYRGFGGSAPTDVTPRTVMDDGRKAYQHLRDLGFPPEKIILRGYSMGAAVAARIHAEVAWRGDRLGGVIYDRPMASAAQVARAESWIGPIASGITQRSVGDFGAASHLARLPAWALESESSTPVRVLVDTSLHGPMGSALAERHKFPVIATNADHFGHQAANRAAREFLAECARS